jgi:hypothetical protein
VGDRRSSALLVRNFSVENGEAVQTKKRQAKKNETIRLLLADMTARTQEQDRL